MDNPTPNTTPVTPAQTPAQPPATQPLAPAPAQTVAAAVKPELSLTASLMLQQFKMLDTSQSGVGLDKLRPFYPRIGWDKIHAWVHELEAANLLSSRPVLNQRGGVSYRVYTWKEA